MSSQIPAIHPPDWLQAAVQQAKDRELGSGLESVYKKMPNTLCVRRGECCGLLPPAAPAELLGFLLRLPKLSAGARVATVTRLVHHFIRNAANRLKCPWAKRDSCADYANRFFACRAYGLWSPEAYDQRRQTAHAAQEQVKDAWAGLGIELPEEVLAPGPDYCGSVRPVSGAPLDDKALLDLEADLAALTQDLDGIDELAAHGNDLSHLMAALVLGTSECLRQKMGYTRATLEGDEHQAQRVLKYTRLTAKEWVLRQALAQPHR